MKIVVDMNLSPEWVGVFGRLGVDAVHWSAVGDPRAEDSVLMAWARENGRIVFTHDLDFGAVLALTRRAGPSVIQVRTQNVSPGALAPRIENVLRRFKGDLHRGAIVSVDEGAARVRVLLLRGSGESGGPKRT